MSSVGFLHSITRPDAKGRFHSGIISRVELSRHIGDEMDLVCRKGECSRNLLVTLFIGLLTDRGIEIIADELGKVSILRVREKQLLGQHAA